MCHRRVARSSRSSSGGGEPFAFHGFAELLERLHATTALALNVTTIGTLLTPALLDRVGPLLGQVRLSLHAPIGAPRRAASPRRRRDGAPTC